MSLSLQLMSKFKNDLKKYRSALSTITDIKTKTKYQHLIEEFERHVKLIDNAHDINLNGYVKPTTIRENVIEAYYIRRQLSKLTKDLDGTQSSN